MTATIPTTSTRLTGRVAANLTALFSALEGVTLSAHERKVLTDLAFFGESAVVAAVIERVRQGACSGGAPG